MAITSDDLAADLESFRLQYPIDNDAYNYIVNSPLEVQQEVLRDFKPKQEGEEDYSALVIGFTKRRRQLVKERQTQAALQYDTLHEDVEAFRARYPMDDEAFRFLSTCPPHVQRQVLQNFKPKREGEKDYSALLITFAKRTRQSQPAQPQIPQPMQAVYMDYGAPPYEPPVQRDFFPRGGVNYEAFRARYPFDDAAHNYLQKLPPDVRIHVLQNFKPPREGEADYSALVISYCKRMRERMQPGMQPAMAMPAMAMPGIPMQHVQQVQQVQQVQHVPMQPSYETRAVPQRAVWNPPVQPAAAPRGTLMGASETSNANIYALEGFRQRYPMDDRAFDFLKCAPAFVQQEVLERFSPQREDSDYSALIISFAKKCREREQQMTAAKRPRMF